MTENSTANQVVAKTVITLTMIHPVDLDPAEMSPADIAYHLDEGEFVGGRTAITTIAVPDHDVQRELKALGNDGTFFQLSEAVDIG